LPHNSITNPVITLTHKSSGLDGGPAGGPDGGPDGGPAGGPDGGPAGGPDGGPAGGPDGGPAGGPDGGPAGGPDGGPAGGPDGGGDGESDGGAAGGPEGAGDEGTDGGPVGAGDEGTAGGPVGAGDEGTDGGPEGALESNAGTISVSAATSVDAASDSRSTGAVVVGSATTSSFSHGGVLTSFVDWAKGAESGSVRAVPGLDFSQGGVRGASSSSSISAAAPTFIFVAPPSAFSP